MYSIDCALFFTCLQQAETIVDHASFLMEALMRIRFLMLEQVCQKQFHWPSSLVGIAMQMRNE